MPELLVMRHGKSDWGTGLPDFERPLSKRGHKNAMAMAEWLDDTDREPDEIITSAANRTFTTAAHVAAHFKLDEQILDARPDLYLAGAHEWIEAVAACSAERVLICGHNPGLDDLVGFLSNEAAELTADGKLMTTAAIAVFSIDQSNSINTWSSISPDNCTLIELMRPRDLL